MKLLLSPLLLLELASCQPDQTTATKSAQPDSSVAPHALAGAATDTLAVADSLGHQVGILQLRPSTLAEFAKLPAGPLPARPSDRENQLNAPDAPLPTGGRVQRQGDLLLLHPAQGPAVTLKPVPSPDGPEGNDNAYYYWGSLPQVHQ